MSMYFNGTSSYAVIPAAVMAGRNVFSFRAIIRTSQAVSNSDGYSNPTVFGFDTSGDGSNDISIRLTNGCPQVYCGLASGDKFIESATAINDGAEHILTGTCDGSTATLYVDGVAIGTISGLWKSLVSNDWYIGAAGLTVGLANITVKEAALWSRCLSAAEASASVSTLTNGLLALFKQDSGYNSNDFITVLTDYSGNGNNGTVKDVQYAPLNPAQVFITYVPSTGTLESGDADMQRFISGVQQGNSDTCINAVIRNEKNADMQKIVRYLINSNSDTKRIVKGRETANSDVKQSIIVSEGANKDTMRIVKAAERISSDMLSGVKKTETTNSDTYRHVLYNAIAETANADIMRVLKYVEIDNADILRDTKAQQQSNSDMILNAVISEWHKADTIRVVQIFQKESADILRKVLREFSINADTQRWVLLQSGAESGNADMRLSAKIIYSGNADTFRHVVLGDSGNADILRRVPFSVNVDGDSLAYQGFGLHLHEKVFSDAFDLVTPAQLSADDQISGKVGDFNFSFLVENTRKIGAGLSSITGRYNQDYIFYTAYYVNSVANAVISAGPFGYNRILDLPVKSYFHSFRYGQKISGMLTFSDIMNQLYGWTTRIPTMQINVFIRAEALYIVQRGYEPNTIDITNEPHTLPEISTELMRLTWNYDTENGNGGAQTIDQTPDPFTGSITFGDSVNEYVGGLLMTETRDNETTEYTYTTYDGQNMYPEKKVITNTKDNTVTTTEYSYLPTNDAKDVYLYEEDETTVKTSTTGKTSQTVRKTLHTPTTAGWYGHRLYVDDRLQSTSLTQGKPGQKVTLYSINEANKSLNSTQNTKTSNSEKPSWYLIRANGFPFAKSDTDDINRVNRAYALLNRSTKEEISFDLYGLTHIIDFTDLILYEGNEYHLVSNDILKTPTELKQHIVFNRYIKNGVTL